MVANITTLTSEDITKFQDKLEYYTESPMLEYFMCCNVSMDWDKSVYYKEVYQMLKATMYYDEHLKMWLMK